MHVGSARHSSAPGFQGVQARGMAFLTGNLESLLVMLTSMWVSEG